jgi:hypothetical protein
MATARFSDDELEVLRHLIEPKSMGDLIFSILQERHNLPEWVAQARAADWEPPHRWHDQERKLIHATATRLMDRGVLSLGIKWKLTRTDNPNEMQIIAEQAS